MSEGSPLGLVWVVSVTICTSEKVHKKPFSLEESGWL